MVLATRRMKAEGQGSYCGRVIVVSRDGSMPHTAWELYIRGVAMKKRSYLWACSMTRWWGM
eukprot:1158500-Pelagomonas_calceolata.AAC.7